MGEGEEGGRGGGGRGGAAAAAAERERRAHRFGARRLLVRAREHLRMGRVNEVREGRGNRAAATTLTP